MDPARPALPHLHPTDIESQAQETAAGEQDDTIEGQVAEIAAAGRQQEIINTGFTIVRLPEYMREANDLFEPRVVSIGPYHRGKESTREMEAHKDRFIQGFFQRLGHVNLEYYTQQIAPCFAQALRCYGGDVGGYTVEMLARDGCFIIELLLLLLEGAAHVDNYVRLMWNSIYSDILIVDNQIPFFILNMLFDIFNSRCQENQQLCDLYKLATNFFNHEGLFSWANDLTVPDYLSDANLQVRHLLDLQYKLATKNMDIQSTQNTYPFSVSRLIHPLSPMPRGIPGANELHDYGIRFRQNKKQQPILFDVSFQGGTMIIPRFEINSGSKILLANLFAYDQIEGQLRNYVGPITSYVLLLNALINTRDDITVLQREGILDNLLSNEEEVASFFNQLGRCRMVDVRDHNYTSMFNHVNRYWRNPFNVRKYRAMFRLKHFRNPWTYPCLLGAILLLIFSCISMVFAILKYYKRG